MTFVRVNPRTGFEKATRRMNEFFNEMSAGVSFEVGGFNPRVDIIDEEKQIIVYAELPGVNKEDLNISLNEEKMLTLSGEKKRDKDLEGKSFVRSERVYSEFKRSFVLPDNADIDKINAKYDNGLLKLTIPKVEPQAPREIKVDIV